MTFAMAIIFFVMWTIWAFQANGFGGFILHLFGPKGETTGFMKVIMVVIFVVVGCLEVVSILFRPVSLAFRLYGNVFAGENMLEAMSNLVRSPGLAAAPLRGVDPDSLLLHGAAGRHGAGAGFHAPHGGFHPPHLPARG